MRRDLEKVIQELRANIRGLCRELEMRDITISPYYTLAISLTTIKIKGKAYERIQLKGYVKEEKKIRSETIKSWKKNESLRQRLDKLVKLYRAYRYLLKAYELL